MKTTNQTKSSGKPEVKAEKTKSTWSKLSESKPKENDKAEHGNWNCNRK